MDSRVFVARVEYNQTYFNTDKGVQQTYSTRYCAIPVRGPNEHQRGLDAIDTSQSCHRHSTERVPTMYLFIASTDIRAMET